jgi:TolB-like protein
LALPRPLSPTPTALDKPRDPAASGAAGAEPVVAARSVFAGPPAEPPPASIAVLPFANLGGDVEQDYFALGLAEDLIADLSKLRGLTSSLGIPRSPWRTARPIRAWSRAGSACYLVEGSVRQASNQLRIDAQLLDVATMTYIWADRFEGDPSDVFRLQDAVIARVVNALAGARPASWPTSCSCRPNTG